MKKIAFFGLGEMGEPMAKNLLKAGFSVTTAIHRNRAPAERLEPLGLTICPSPAEAVKDADVVIGILVSDAATLSHFEAPDLAGAIKPGTIFMEMSSCCTETMMELSQFYKARGVRVVDAPVSGGSFGAEAATLSIMCGSDDETAIQEVDDILHAAGKSIYNVGKCGAGKIVKNLNNLLLMLNIRGLAEVYSVAKAEGIDINMLADVISTSSGNSFAVFLLRTFTEERKYGPSFAMNLVLKDLANALKINDSVPMPLTSCVYQIFKEDNANGVR